MVKKIPLASVFKKPVSGEWGTTDETGTGISVIRTANFTDIGKIDYTDIVTRQINKEKIEKKKLKYGDILIEKSGGTDTKPVGRVVFFEKKDKTFVYNNFSANLRIENKKQFDSKYLFYFLFHFYWKGGTCPFENKTTGIHNLKLEKMLQKVEIPMLPLEEQKEIARRLDLISLLIDKQKEQLEKLDELVKSQFIEMFGDPLSNHTSKKTLRLKDICIAIRGGGTPSKSHPEYYTGNIPWVTPKDMKSKIIMDSLDHITEEAISASTTNLIPKNSVLMVIRSGVLKHTLPVAINQVPVTVNQDMKAFIPNDKITSDYLLCYFKAIEQGILAGVRSVTADNIDFKSFQERSIIVPPIEEQEHFTAIARQVDKSKFELQQSIEKLETLKKSLMQEYFG